MNRKQEQIVVNQLSTLFRQHGDALRTVAASSHTQRAAYISQIVAARPDLWTASQLMDMPTSALEKIARQLSPGSFSANGLCVNADEEQELPDPWENHFGNPLGAAGPT